MWWKSIIKVCIAVLFMGHLFWKENIEGLQSESIGIKRFRCCQRQSKDNKGRFV